jgi:hypothetical protein
MQQVENAKGMISRTPRGSNCSSETPAIPASHNGRKARRKAPPTGTNSLHLDPFSLVMFVRTHASPLSYPNR